MNNITELRDELAQVFNRLKEGDIDVKAASEMNNCAGKMINTVKVQLDYYELTGDKPSIPFIDG